MKSHSGWCPKTLDESLIEICDLQALKVRICSLKSNVLDRYSPLRAEVKIKVYLSGKDATLATDGRLRLGIKP